MSWWQTLWKNQEIIDSRYLNRDTYHQQKEKIQEEMVKLSTGIEPTKKLDSAYIHHQIQQDNREYLSKINGMVVANE